MRRRNEPQKAQKAQKRRGATDTERMKKTARPILLAIAIAIVAFAIYRRAVPEKKAVTPASGNDVVLQVRSIPVIHNLALGDFEIPAKSTHDVKITFDENGRNVRLSGEFATAGGPGIQVMLLNEDQYNRFQNHQAPSEVLFMSKVSQKGNIEADIPRVGTYHLVFDNSSSDSVAKVHADVALRYEMVHVDSGQAPKK
jgi:hypothetical protein